MVVGYGEVWTDAEAEEAELARILVEPARRGRGVGRMLTTLLADEARALGYDEIWLRVVRTNAAALAAYEGAGFARTTDEQEREFNAGQPREYVWLRAPAA